MQQKMMKYMPLMFLFMLYNFSAGLTLYWTVQNLLSILQMKLTRTQTAAPGPRGGRAHPQGRSAAALRPRRPGRRQLFNPAHHMPVKPKETLEKLLALLELPAAVDEHLLEDGLLLDIKADDQGRLIGRQGRTLADLQYLLNRICFQQARDTPKVTLDVGSYRIQAREALIQKAKDAAEKVRRWGDIVELEPMNAFDRRIVHQAIRDDPDIETHSVEVEGTDKKVILLRPKR
jgi:spoIIIJ-associated protein